MATSKDLSHSVLNASAEVVENPCKFCLTRDNKDIESGYFCVDCDLNLCLGCKKWHRDIPSMKSHQVVEISKAAPERQHRPTQRCHEHHGKIIDEFCLDHEALACDSCVSMYHRMCTHVEYFPGFANYTKKGKETLAIIKSAQSTLKALKDMKSSRQNTLQQLDTANRQSQQAVQDRKYDIVKWVDGLAKTECAFIDSNFRGNKHVVKTELQTVDDHIDVMETILNDLNESNDDNKSELFVYIKQGQQNAKDGERMMRTLQQSRTMIPKFKFHENIEKSLSNIKSLGTFDDESDRDSHRPVTLTLRGEYIVKTTDDENVCDITGACSLPDGSYVIADFKNRKLKHLDNSYKIIAYIPMSSGPCDVCYTTNSSEVAVTLPYAKTIKLICVARKMKETMSFTTDDICRSIAFSDTELFVGCGNTDDSPGSKVRVYNLSGTHLRTIQFNTTGEKLFSITWRITVSSCGRKVHVTDNDNVIITTDRQGNLLFTFSDPDLKWPTGICTLDNGDMLVCGYTSNTVIHVSRDGRKLGVVLGKQDGIVEPQIPSYDSVNSRLVVSSDRSDTIKVYDVHIE